MIILIDSGNSRLKVGWLDASNPDMPREPAAVAFDGLDLAALDRWLDGLPRRPLRALGVNVAGDARARGHCRDPAQARLRRDLGPLAAQHAGTDQRLPPAGPAGLGPVGVAAGRAVAPARAHPPFLLASFGTATTIDTVGPDNVFAGGLILPGPAMMRNALAHGTANLPVADGRVVAYPADTHEAIASGIAAAQPAR